MYGVIERIVPDGRFGFIRGEDGREFFFHQTALAATAFEEIAPGSRVEFTVTEDAPGDAPDENPRAVHVRLSPDELPAVDNEPLPPEKAGESP